VDKKEENMKEEFYSRIRDLLLQIKQRAVKTVNFASVLSNWYLGKSIVEEEQNGRERAEYGKYLIKELSQKLTADLGSGYDITNLKLFRKFYLAFPVWSMETQKGDTLSNLFPEILPSPIGDKSCNQFQKYYSRCSKEMKP